MKKMLLALLLVVSLGMLVAVESAPSAVVGYVKYPCVTGNNLIALPMNAGYTMASDLSIAYPGKVDAISFWDETLQDWTTAIDLVDFWDGDFPVGNGSVLMVNALEDFNFFSLGSMFPTNAQYNLLAGNNTVILPLNYSAMTSAGELGVSMGADAVSMWDNSLQDWTTAVDLVDFWDGDFTIGIGFPVMANVVSPSVWPAGPRGNVNTNSFRSSNK